jgi:hypothetical protein
MIKIIIFTQKMREGINFLTVTPFKCPPTAKGGVA